MSVFDDTVKLTRPVLTIFFILDTSACMAGEKIEMLNREIEESIPIICELSYENEFQIKIAVLESSDYARWINTPIKVENFIWNHLDAGGNADLGTAFETLNDKLSIRAFMQDQKSFSPIIIFVSDGINLGAGEKPFTALKILKNNKWFKEGIRAAIAIGEDANIDLLAEFTGSKDAVIRFRYRIIPHLIKEAIRSMWIVLDRPIDLEDERELQIIFNDRIKDFHPPISNNDVSDDDWQ
jgi:uncharacterized protein YegL